jgi:hypothetical protein
LEGLVLDFYLAAIAPQFSRAQINLKGAEAHNPRRIAGH